MLEVVATVAGFAAGVVLLVYLGRGLWFFTDEWAFLLNRRDLTLANLLRPHNEHFVAIPVLIYQGLFALGGLSSYWPYYLTAVAFHACATLAGWAVLKRLGVPWPVALLAAMGLLLMGAAGEQLFNAFQFGWTAPILLFLTALLLLDRPRPRDLAAAGCLALAMPFGGVALALALGLAAALVVSRHFHRALVVAGPALAIYLVWRVGWGISPPITLDALVGTPGYVGYGLASSMAGFTGLPLLVTGALLATLGVAVVARVLRGGLPLTGWAALFAVLAFFGSAGVARVSVWGVVQAGSSRYLYIGMMLLLIVLAAALRPLWHSAAVLAVVVLAACLIVNLLTLREMSREARRLKGETAARILAADSLLAEGLPHAPSAQPDPMWAPDVTGGKLDRLRSQGIPLAYGGPVEVTDAIRREQRLRMQVALTGDGEPTADLRLVRATADVAPRADGCMAVAAAPGTAVELEATPGILVVQPHDDSLVQVRRTGEGTEFFQFELRAGTPRHLELAVPMEAGNGGLLSLAFPVEADLDVCPRSFVDGQ